MKSLPELPTCYFHHEYPEYWPTCPEDFIGDARVAATMIARAIEGSRKRGKKPECFLLSGGSGTGKTTMKYLIMHLAKISKWGVQEFNGADVSVDLVRELHAGLHLTANDMFGEYRLIVLNEVDHVPKVAQVRALSLLEEAPRGTIFLATANSNLIDLETRLHGRFKFATVNGASVEETVEFLRRWNIPEAIAKSIAITAQGSLRIALQEAEEWLQSASVAA
jgi:replication-associated recombination protein RarA